LFDLFFSFNEFYADNDFGDQFRGPLRRRQCFWASIPGLKTMVSVAIREPDPKEIEYESRYRERGQAEHEGFNAMQQRC
jgi:hypothetical protein